MIARTAEAVKTIYNVLIVDDDKIVVDGLMSFFPWAEEGFHVAGGVQNAVEAQNLLDTYRVDILITDIAMPNVNGLELITRALTVNPVLKSIVLSGYNDFGYAVNAIRLGAVNYLLKPVDFDELRDTLRKISESLASEEQQRLEYRRMAREQFLAALAYGSFKSEQSLRYQMKRAELSIPEDLAGVAIRCWSDKAEKCPGPDSEMMGALERCLAPSGAVFVFSCDAGDVSAFYFPDGEDYIAVLRGLTEDLKTRADVPYSIGVGSPFWSLRDAQRSFTEAEKALVYSHIEKGNRIQFYDDIKTFSNSHCVITAEAESRIGEMFECRDTAGLSQYLYELLAECRESFHDDGETLYMAGVEALLLINRFDSYEKPPTHQRASGIYNTIRLLRDAKDLPGIQQLVNNYVETLFDPPAKKPGGLSVQYVQSYIRDHLNEDLTLARLAKIGYVHPNYLSRLFKECTGETVMDYITRARVEHACALLGDPSRRITEVSEEVGYNSPKHFSQVFREIMKCTPTEYRNSLAAPMGSGPQ